MREHDILTNEQVRVLKLWFRAFLQYSTTNSENVKKKLDKPESKGRMKVEH